MIEGTLDLLAEYKLPDIEGTLDDLSDEERAEDISKAIEVVMSTAAYLKELTYGVASLDGIAVALSGYWIGVQSGDLDPTTIKAPAETVLEYILPSLKEAQEEPVDAD